MTEDTSTSWVLIVEDDAQLRQTLRDVLEIAGYSVTLARNGVEALQILDETGQQPALIVSDINMEQMDGVEFFETIRDKWRWGNVPFIFLSGKREAGVDPISQRAVTFISKPFQVPELLASIENLLDQARLAPAIDIKFEIEGQEVPAEHLGALVDNAMLVGSMQRMGTAIQQELGDMLCPVHHLPPQVIVSLSRSGGLQAQVRGCCDVLVKTTTAPLRRTIKQTAPFGTPTDLIIRVVDSDQSWTIDVNEIEELVIGRSDPSSETPPGIDLVGEGAAEKGVSRRHATIFWWDGGLTYC